MANNQHKRTLKELAVSDVTYQPLGIQYPDVDAPFELKSSLIHLLHKFNSSAALTSSRRPHQVEGLSILLRWCSEILAILPAAKVCHLLDRHEEDVPGEVLPCFQSSHNQKKRSTTLDNSAKKASMSIISDQLLIQYFYESLAPMERSMLDVASGGTLMDKKPSATKALIDNMAEKSRQFNTRAMAPMREVHNVQQPTYMAANSSRLNSRIEELTTFVRQLAVVQQTVPQGRVTRDCHICSSIEHTSDYCPLLHESSQQASGHRVFSERQDQYRVLNFQQPQRQQQLYRFQYQSHNLAFNDHPNMRYGTSEQQQQQHTSQPSNGYRPPPMRQQ
ncbi:uncharacterized protein LOC113852022 [Abrus precatorius]|uniref:Uncharacterized protein LOC113852022 n=1 Tax=Abrus precatorius TaxID=3816 RepID=A0A8B8K408_ABRPR|nr:uncharacterized protein LOC113852022 [Abrus precatorius]